MELIATEDMMIAIKIITRTVINSTEQRMSYSGLFIFW